MHQQQTKTIGIFDSGFGGLTILHHLQDALPEYSFIYLGDNSRAPYGTKDRKTVTSYTEEAINFLFDQGAALIIIACNTATTAALRYLQGKYMRDIGRTDRNILGIIVPTVEAELPTCHHTKLGIFGTPLTVQSGVYEKEMKKFHPDMQVRSVACPKLMPLVEAGREHTDEARLACEEYLDKLQDFDCDTILLGCTHYPYLLEHFRSLRPDITFIEQGPIVAAKTKDYLSRHREIDQQLLHTGTVTFFTTGDSAEFQRLGSRYYQGSILKVAHADLTK